MKQNRNRIRDIGFYVLLLLIIVAVIATMTRDSVSESLAYSDLVDLFKAEKVESFVTEGDSISLKVKTDNPEEPLETKTYSLYSFSVFYEDFHELIWEQHEAGIIKEYDYKEGFTLPWWVSFVPYLILIGLMVLWFALMNRQGGGAGGIAKFSRARTRLGSEEKKKKTFADVAGCDEEKEELAEIVDFLKNPKAFTEMGARIPKGVLLVGPPGTGKTLLAKAVAGEANVQFLSISGSDFVELYVGVGAGRVRDLFDQAKKVAPSIIFIDEIDAVGRQRGSGLGGGHDEREQTLNQLLVEMDGFGNNEGVIVMAATNRADILDNALLRPGRFDRQVYVGLPDIRGREEILKIHSRDKHLAEDVDLNSIAKGTAGFAGADLENLMNEAALLAVRRKHRFISMDDIDEAILKVQMGPEKKSRKVSEKARKLTAYHEAGHAVAARFLEHVDPVHYITIIPRGMAGGFTLMRPDEDAENFTSRAQMFESIVMALGGRVSERLFLDDISTGASGDIQQASSTARDMVMRYGMSEKLGPISYDNAGHSIFIGRDFGTTKSYSEETAAIIDEEVKKIFTDAEKKCEQILTEHADQLKAVAEYLLEHESMDAEEFDYYFVHGEFMPVSTKKVREARNDPSIERPARHISMTDGYAEEQTAAAETEAAPAPVATTEEAAKEENAAPETPKED
ncbi:MAG: ATP-dependent zinc metalloprotease FtsH [Oscillospiraceae bacterium]|nr:ATP-dependent zinc metalloprotease FtsH [Oscillospiraceae bacterium]